MFPRRSGAPDPSPRDEMTHDLIDAGIGERRDSFTCDLDADQPVRHHPGLGGSLRGIGVPLQKVLPRTSLGGCIAGIESR